MNLSELTRLNKIRDEEWSGDQSFSISFRGLELAGEAGELCNELKKVERYRMGVAGGKEPRLENIADEIADVVISANLIAMELGIDLSVAIPRKFNKTSEKYGLKTRFLCE